MTWHRTCRMAMKIHKNTPPSQDLVWAGLTRRASHHLEPGLRLVEHSEIAADLELAVFDPDLSLVDLAVFGIHDGAALVAISVQAQILDDDEPDDGFVLVGARALDADLRLA